MAPLLSNVKTVSKASRGVVLAGACSAGGLALAVVSVLDGELPVEVDRYWLSLSLATTLGTETCSPAQRHWVGKATVRYSHSQRVNALQKAKPAQIQYKRDDVTHSRPGFTQV